MVEFLIIFPILLILTLGTFQLALIYNAKTTLNYAVFHAARSGAVNNAQKEVIDKALIRGLAPLFTSIDGNTSDVQELQAGRDQVKQIMEDGYICIQRINPTPDAFLDFAVKDDMIPNDNLMYRSAAPGGASQLSIQDANLLKLRVTYCHRLIVPFFPRLLQGLMNKTDRYEAEMTAPINAFMRNCYNNSRIPLVSFAMVRMQSDIINDTFPNCTAPL